MLAQNPQSQWAETDRMIEKEIETEICQRFIRLSCEKMLNARHERGGAKLHRNLLILHLLRKARTDSKKLPYECSSLLKRQPLTPSSLAVSRTIGAVSPPQENVFLSEAEVENEDVVEEEQKIFEEQEEESQTKLESSDDEDAEIDVVSCDDDPKPVPQAIVVVAPVMPLSFSLPDLSSIKLKQQQQHGGPLEYKVRDQVEADKRIFRGNSLLIGHMSSNNRIFEPLHLPFTSGDAIEEGTDVASLLDEENSKVPELSDDLDQQLQMISPPISPPEAHKLIQTKLQGGHQFLDFDEEEDSNARPPHIFSCQESDQSDDSGTEDDCDDAETEEDGKCKRRKRRTSTPRTSTVAEKRQCTADGDSDSGVDVDVEGDEKLKVKDCELVQPPTNTPTYISVYSTGLGTTVVPQQQSSSSSILHDQQVPVLKRIHSYPLFCK